ncbi:divalent-cation tolerance protein CutA [Thermodesulforhabdus norvegica]|uniref:Divalent cation tolerance protein n=1 Tax=Thermodesulforhabdus norvegica TaxID=39841 RepID=A0A1I4TQ20_9BACT|nr:divalent-cation tolerance protein CutA [Thermodesulforhabdus norvegica]SFM78765.1 divalent cation tolerance protein [Thermodesulforhabdus norvegica]
MNTAAQNVMVVLVTVPNAEEASRIAKTVVQEKLAACVNIVPQIRSVYSWKGEVCDDPESLMIIKTRAELFGAIRDRIKELHSYEVPEIIGVRLSDGIDGYISWVFEVTRSSS